MISSWGVEFEPVNILGNPEAQSELRKLGVPAVPATVVEDRAVHGWNPEALARLLEVPYQGVPTLPPLELAEKLDAILAQAQYIIGKAPSSALETVHPERPRTVRDLAFHLFRLSAGFVDTFEAGFHHKDWLYESAPDAIRSGADIARYGSEVRRRLEKWFSAAADHVFSESVSTYYGEQTVQALLERTAWHAGQHLRQVHALLESAGNLPEESLDSTLFDGLPMPAAIW